ncbi:MAG: indole-3-glycerol phosphate synthase TrpC [Bacillota bacterium]
MDRLILDEILTTKTAEVAASRAARPIREWRAVALGGPAPRGFLRALAAPDGVQVIGEIKRASPSRGLIRPDFDPAAIARAYEAAGAACVSVLTDQRYFRGELRYLSALRAVTGLPLLRKDFIIDEVQVYEARAAGADGILLIVAAFSGPSAGNRRPGDLDRLADLAWSVGLDILVETHTAEELDLALAAGFELIGINNRDLATFETDLEVTLRLAPRVPSTKTVVSESGIRTPDDVRRVAAAGVKAVLVGEALMRGPDPGATLRWLRGGPADVG